MKNNQDLYYLHIEPNSHFFTDIKQILEHMKYYEHNANYIEYLKIGLENTLKNGYNIQQIDDDNQFKENFE